MAIRRALQGHRLSTLGGVTRRWILVPGVELPSLLNQFRDLVLAHPGAAVVWCAHQA